MVNSVNCGIIAEFVFAYDKGYLGREDAVAVSLTIVDYPTGYILKPQTAEYKELPEHEHLAMNSKE